jgi:D-alanine-D-alanine ligase-like ATP-grasp enzyme
MKTHNPVALPPTEIIKGGEVYDYRSKYLAGLSHKETPMRLPDAEIERVRMACEELLAFLSLIRMLVLMVFIRRMVLFI